MSNWIVRGRALLDEWFALVAVGLVVLATVGAGVTYATHVAPGTTTVDRPGPTWETHSGFNHSARVVDGDEVFSEGEVLTDRDVYYTNVAPVLNGTYAVTYGADRGGSVAGTVDVDLVYRSVGSEKDTETVYWRRETDLRERQVESVAPGETVSVPFSVNASAVGDRTEHFRETVGDGPGQIEAVVVATVRFEGTVNDRSVDWAWDQRMPLRPDRDYYRVDDPGARTTDGGQTRQVTVPRTYGPARTVGGPALLVAAVLALAGLAVARYRGRIALSAAERDYLDYRDDRADFDEWISRVALPDEAFARPRAEAASLADLVDLAIDADTAVVEDPGDGTCYVVHGEYLYVFDPPSEPDAGSDPGEDPAPDGSDGEAAATDLEQTADGRDDGATDPSSGPTPEVPQD